MYLVRNADGHNEGRRPGRQTVISYWRKTMNALATQVTVGEPSQVFMLTAADLESVVRKIFKEEADRRDAERSSLMITSSEVCHRRGIDPSTLWRWRKAGRLKGVRVGREYLFKETDVSLMLDGGRRL